MTNEPDWESLARYCAGEATRAEGEELLAWAARDPSNAELLDTALQAWVAAGDAGGEWDSEAAWVQLQGRMDGRPPIRLRGGARPGGSRYPRAPLHGARWAIAAAFACVVAAGALGIAFWTGERAGSGALAIRELITQKGERARIRLSDGSEVVIGPESRLTVAARFGDSAREVELAGEAYFDVASDPSRPFVVTAGRTVTEVIGTEFGVRAYLSDPAVQVVVAEGQVAFRREGGEAAGTPLREGELGEILSGSSRVTRRHVDLDSYLGWRDGRLAFEDAPLSQIVAQLERWYGIPVRIGDASLRNRRLTASFRGQPVDEVIAVVAASLGLEYVKVGQVYTFFAKGSSSVFANSDVVLPDSPEE